MVLMLVACLGLGLGWQGNRIRRIANERSVVPQILAMGGKSAWRPVKNVRGDVT
jgi:hypothetical protein